VDYKRIEKEKYRLHFMKTDKYKTVLMKVSFKQEIEEKLITEYSLLSGLLSNSSFEFKTLKEMILKVEDLYQLKYDCSSATSGNYILFGSFVKFINEKYTEKGMNEASIKFFLDSLFKPNIDSDGFKKDIFDLEKNNYMEYLEGKDDDPSRYANQRFNEILGCNTPLIYDPSGDIEILKNIDEKSIYNTYLNLLNNSSVDIFFIGNMEVDEVTKIIDLYFNDVNTKKINNTHFVTLPNTEIKEKKEKSNFTQSKLRMGFTISDLTDFERQYVLPVYNFILGGDSDSLLFKNVREKNSLCYSVYSNYITVYSTLRIVADIASKDYELAVSIIKEMVERMKNGDFDEDEMDKVKLNYKTSYREITDSNQSILNILESHEYLNYDLPEERIKKIDSVTKDMVISVANRVNLNVIYFLEGNDGAC